MMLIKQAFLQFLAIALLASSSNAKALIALEVLMGHPLYGKLFIVSPKKSPNSHLPTSVRFNFEFSGKKPNEGTFASLKTFVPAWNSNPRTLASQAPSVGKNLVNWYTR